MQATLLITVLALGAPALKEKGAKTTIVGEWVAEQCIVSGRPPAQWKGETRWVFKSDGARSISKGGQQLVTGTYSIDTRKSPAILDLDPNAPAGSYPCIYKIEEDTLTLNVGWQKAPRPEAFDSPPGSLCTLYVFKRVTAKD